MNTLAFMSGLGVSVAQSCHAGSAADRNGFAKSVSLGSRSCELYTWKGCWRNSLQWQAMPFLRPFHFRCALRWSCTSGCECASCRMGWKEWTEDSLLSILQLSNLGSRRNEFQKDSGEGKSGKRETGISLKRERKGKKKMQNSISWSHTVKEVKTFPKIKLPICQASHSPINLHFISIKIE